MKMKMKKTKMKIYNSQKKSIIYKVIYITLFSNSSLRQKVYDQQYLTLPDMGYLEELYTWGGAPNAPPISFRWRTYDMTFLVIHYLITS